MNSQKVRFFASLLLLAMTAAGCAIKPLLPVAPAKLPALNDDLSRASLTAAVRNSISYLEELEPTQEFAIYDQTCTAARLLASLQTFAAIIEQSLSTAELRRRVLERFDVYQARGSGFWSRGRMLVTGYYEPVLAGSLTRSPPFLYPLYTVPGNLVTLPEKGIGAQKTGRLENGVLLPYWTRAEIEENPAAAGLTGSELVYLADPMDVFILHVQGSGKIRLRDGSLRNVHFAATNGRPYRSIGRLLVDEDRLALNDVTLPRIRQYLADHPADRDRILRYNESYIFFRWEEGPGPIGSLGEVLTPGRSVAADQDLFPAGALCFLQSEKPVLDQAGAIVAWTPFSRFVLLQDSGTAIKGSGRLDIFWGSDEYAETAAGAMKQPGKLYILVLKREAAAKRCNHLKKNSPRAENDD